MQINCKRQQERSLLKACPKHVSNLKTLHVYKKESTEIVHVYMKGSTEIVHLYMKESTEIVHIHLHLFSSSIALCVMAWTYLRSPTIQHIHSHAQKVAHTRICKHRHNRSTHTHMHTARTHIHTLSRSALRVIA
jgi:hypothetical protein